MEALFVNIQSILMEQADMLNTMKDTAREHHRALCQLNLDDVKEIIQKEQSLTEAFKKLEDERMAVSLMTAKKLSLPEDIGFKLLINKAPFHLRESLTGLLDRMTKLLAELSEISKINEALTKQALGVYQMIFNSIKGMGEHYYSSDGVVAGSSSISLLDRKA